MNARARAIASGSLVAATSAVLVVSATAAAIGADDQGHRVASVREGSSRDRASLSGLPASGLPVVDPSVRAHSDAVVIVRWTNAVNAFNAARWYATATEEVSRVGAAGPRRPAGNRGNVMDCIKHRESRGQYDVVNSSSGAAGAYQFMPNTWNNTARSAGRPDLVGVNPSSASAADQDAMAQHLLATQGLGPWGGGCG